MVNDKHVDKYRTETLGFVYYSSIVNNRPKKSVNYNGFSLNKFCRIKVLFLILTEENSWNSACYCIPRGTIRYNTVTALLEVVPSIYLYKPLYSYHPILVLRPDKGVDK